MGEGPSLTTRRLLAVPLTMWNAGFVAAEIVEALGDPRGVRTPGTNGGRRPEGPPGQDLAAALRRDLRRRATSGPEILTWAVRDEGGSIVGMLSSDTSDRRAVVTVSIAPAHRRKGYATEALRAVAGWIEAGATAVVEARVRLGDVPSERLVRATSFLPTDVFLADHWQVWMRPPVG